MLADFFTKPLQGALFTTFRDVVLGYRQVDSLHSVLPTEPEERVGNKNRAVDRWTKEGTDGSAGTVDEDGFTLVTGKKKLFVPRKENKVTTTSRGGTLGGVSVHSKNRTAGTRAYGSELVSKRSFSRNNPVNGDRV